MLDVGIEKSFSVVSLLGVLRVLAVNEETETGRNGAVFAVGYAEPRRGGRAVGCGDGMNAAGSGLAFFVPFASRVSGSAWRDVAGGFAENRFGPPSE